MKRIKVWDLVVRLFHWSLTLLILLAFVTADEDDTIPLHARIGLAVLGLVVFRVVWGLVGSPYARFSAFVRSPREVLRYTRDLLRGRPPLHLSHNPLGAVMVVTMLVAIVAVGLTGMLTYLSPLYGGPLPIGEGAAEALEDVHEALAMVLPWLIGAHVIGVIASSFAERQNLVKGMVDGYKRAPDDVVPPPFGFARRLGAFVLATLLSGAAVIGAALLFPIAEANAAEPSRPLLEVYDEDARAEDPQFRGFDAARGRALYLEEHVAKGKRVSCASCHTTDPTRSGRSPAGRVIRPLAPSANDERFRDRKKADKWFDRNCKQVIGRTCSANEKGDVLTWLLTL